MQGAGFWNLQKECWTVASNRKRALLTIGMITFQQWSGVSTFLPSYLRGILSFSSLDETDNLCSLRPALSITTLLRSSRTSASQIRALLSSPKAFTVLLRWSPA